MAMRSSIKFRQKPEIVAYKETPGICPQCQSENVVLEIPNTDFDGDEKIVSEQYLCENCGCKYTETYRMKLEKITIGSME